MLKMKYFFNMRDRVVTLQVRPCSLYTTIFCLSFMQTPVLHPKHKENHFIINR